MGAELNFENLVLLFISLFFAESLWSVDSNNGDCVGGWVRGGTDGLMDGGREGRLGEGPW